MNGLPLKRRKKLKISSWPHLGKDLASLHQLPVTMSCLQGSQKESARAELIKASPWFLTSMKRDARSSNKKLKISEPLKVGMKIAKLHNSFNSSRIKIIS